MGEAGSKRNLALVRSNQLSNALGALGVGDAVGAFGKLGEGEGGGAQLPWDDMVAASRCAWPSLTAGVCGQKAIEQLVEVHGSDSSG